MFKLLILVTLLIAGCETMDYSYARQGDYYTTMECYAGGSKVACDANSRFATVRN